MRVIVSSLKGFRGNVVSKHKAECNSICSRAIETPHVQERNLPAGDVSFLYRKLVYGPSTENICHTVFVSPLGRMSVGYLIIGKVPVLN
jgi:hypothetical protein